MLKYQKKTDEEIVELVKAEDLRAFDILMKRYEGRLISYLTRLLNNKEDAREILQDTFIKVYENIQSFKARLKFSSWIYRIAHNLAINYLKKRNRVITFDHDVLVSLPLSKETISEFMDQQQKVFSREEVMDCLNKIKDKYKDVLILYYYEDRTYEEISDVLRKPLSTVKTWLRRAKQNLKEVCNEHGEK